MEIRWILKNVLSILLTQTKKKKTNNKLAPPQTAQFDHRACFRTHSALPSVKNLKTTVSPVPFMCCSLSLLSSSLHYFTTFGTQLSLLQFVPSGAVSLPLCAKNSSTSLLLSATASNLFLSSYAAWCLFSIRALLPEKA